MPKPASTRPAYKMLTCIYLCRTLLFFAPYADFFEKKDYFKSFIRKQEEKVFIDSQMVVGCSCLEYDKLFTLQNQPLLNVGDRILYQNVGAYTMTLSPLFIRFFPRVYLKTLNGYEIIREEWTVNDLKQ